MTDPSDTHRRTIGAVGESAMVVGKAERAQAPQQTPSTAPWLKCGGVLYRDDVDRNENRQPADAELAKLFGEQARTPIVECQRTFAMLEGAVGDTQRLIATVLENAGLEGSL